MTGYLLLVIIAFGLIILMQAPPLAKNKQWRELAAFALYLWIGLVATIPLVLGIRIPSPHDLILELLEPAVNWIMKPPP